MASKKPSNALSPEARKAVAVASGIVYGDQGVEMLQQQLANTKSPDAIPAAVSTAASTILFRMKPKLDALPQKEVWGEMGVVHLVLDAVFEVAKELGYKAPLSALRPAYEAVEQALEQQAPNGAPPQDGAPSPMQGAPPQQAPQGQQPMPMQGAMPDQMGGL